MQINSIKQGPNKGLPVLQETKNATSFYEFWPVWVFYLPVVVYWFWLAIRYRGFGLPLLANPNVFLAGMIGESKVDLLASAIGDACHHILPFVSFVTTGEIAHDVKRAREQLNLAGIDFPMVAKPDKGCRGAGVQVVSSEQALKDYLHVFPVGQVLMLQQLSEYKAEAGVFYVRRPHEPKGHVVSVTLKYRATVTGDGKHTLGELVLADTRACQLSDLYQERLGEKWNATPPKGEEVPLVFAGSHCRGAIFKDGCRYITDELSQKIDALMQGFSDFYYGRLDIKFDDINTFVQGKSFDIIEINGASSEQTHIWDSRTPVFTVIKTLLQQYKTLFQIGGALRDKGLPIPSLKTLIKVWLHDLTSDQSYPKTH